ncbi:MAG: PQQ-dependent sugar dehydrogenase [Dehalococcoidia bacterium]
MRRIPWFLCCAFAALTASLAIACGESTAKSGQPGSTPDTTAIDLAFTPGPTIDEIFPSEGLTLAFPATQRTLVSLPVGYRIESVLDGLELPTGVAALPDGRFLITEQQSGDVRAVKNGVLQRDPWLELDVSFPPGKFVAELGLDNIAVDPDFEKNHYVYVYFTENQESGERHTVLARFLDKNGKGTNRQDIVVIDVPAEETHVAGGIAFDGDAILLGVGDHERPQSALDLSEPTGKILRIDREGEALPDNPFADDPNADPRVYAYGMRNPFGIGVDSETGRAYFSDNRDTIGDALYELKAGANYAWPLYRVNYRLPLAIYDVPQGMAGLIVYHGDTLSIFDGDVLFCTYHNGGGLHWSEPGQVVWLEVYKRDRLIAPACGSGITQGSDGFVYYLDYGAGRLLRISN